MDHPSFKRSRHAHRISKYEKSFDLTEIVQQNSQFMQDVHISQWNGQHVVCFRSCPGLTILRAIDSTLQSQLTSIDVLLKEPAAATLDWTSLRGSGNRDAMVGLRKDSVKAYCGTLEMLTRRGGRYAAQLLRRGRKHNTLIMDRRLQVARNKVFRFTRMYKRSVLAQDWQTTALSQASVNSSTQRRSVTSGRTRSIVRVGSGRQGIAKAWRVRSVGCFWEGFAAEQKADLPSWRGKADTFPFHFFRLQHISELKHIRMPRVSVKRSARNPARECVNVVLGPELELLTEQLIIYSSTDKWFAPHHDKDRKDKKRQPVNPKRYDGPGDVIVALCLGTPCTIVVTQRHSTEGSFTVQLQPGDVYCMSGPMRWEWLHGISVGDSANPRSAVVWRFVEAGGDTDAGEEESDRW